MKLQNKNVLPFNEDFYVNRQEPVYFDDAPKPDPDNFECATALLHRLSPLILGSKNPKAVVLLMLYHFGLDIRHVTQCDGDSIASIARYLGITKQSAHEQYETLTRKLLEVAKNN